MAICRSAVWAELSGLGFDTSFRFEWHFRPSNLVFPTSISAENKNISSGFFLYYTNRQESPHIYTCCHSRTVWIGDKSEVIFEGEFGEIGVKTLWMINKEAYITSQR